MRKVKMVLNLCILMVVSIIALGIPAIVEAGSIKIWPDQLKPATPHFAYEQTRYYVRGGTTFFSPLTLPLGVQIVKITYYHSGGTSPAKTTFVLYRGQFAKKPETVGTQSSTDSSNAIIPVDVPIAGDPVIKAGYRYMIWVQVQNSSSCFWGAKIDYQ